MKRTLVATMAFAAALTLPAVTTLAQTDTTQTDTIQSDATQSDATQTNAIQSNAVSDAGRLDSKTSGTNVRVSQLIGQNIRNSQGDSVGEIQDLVVDGNTGKIRYVAITYGGLFGLGDKLFAVPFEAFKVTRNPDDPDDADDFVMVLNVTQKQLEGAKGFDQDHWPNMADKNMLRDLDRRYGIDRSSMRGRDGRADVDVNVNRNGVGVDVDNE